MQVKATARLRYVSIPPRKMRLVADMIKGMPVEKALNILNFTPRIAAHHIAKTLKSAAANALSVEGTDHLKPEDLMVSNVIVDAAPTAKRVRFQSMGRVFRYKKRFCHLTVMLEGEMEEPEKKRYGGRGRKKEETPSEAVEEKAVKEKKAVKTKTAAKKRKSKISELKRTTTKASSAKKTNVRKSTPRIKGDR